MTPLLLIDLVLLFLLVVTAVAAVYFRDLITSVIILCVFSLLMAALYIVMGAPDVAMTEAAVGAGASTLILLASLLLIGDKEKEEKTSWWPLLALIPLFVILCYAVLHFPPYGAFDTPAHQHVAAYYIESSKHEIDIPNIVTAVLASYRAFDTLGEVVVVLTAGLGVWALIGRDKA